jgi:hypothetical protein
MSKGGHHYLGAASTKNHYDQQKVSGSWGTARQNAGEEGEE